MDYWEAEDLDSLIRAYQAFSNYIKSRLSEGGTLELERDYAMWCCRMRDKPDIDHFKGLFERIQIKSYSTAFCETIGNKFQIDR